MSIQKIKPVLEAFVRDEGNDLLVLRGRWGVGKTFFWQTLMDYASRNNRIGTSHYSYVSLFGINNLEELKNAILAGRVEAADIKRKTSTSTKEWKQRFKKLTSNIEK